MEEARKLEVCKRMEGDGSRLTAPPLTASGHQHVPPCGALGTDGVDGYFSHSEFMVSPALCIRSF